MAENLFKISIILYIIAAFFPLLFGARQRVGDAVSFICAGVASSFGIINSLIVLFNGESIHINLLLYHSIIKYNLLIDPVSAYFILAISGITLIASIYSIGYTRLYIDKYDTRPLGFTYNIFLLSMLLVVTANNALVFMIVWELMTLASFFLVIFEHDDPSARRAGFIYIIMAHIGAAFLAVAFFIMFTYTGSFNFDDFRRIGLHIPPIYKNIVFFLVIT